MNPIENKPITIGTRLGSMLLDHAIMVMLMIPFYIPLLISGLSDAFKVSHSQTSTAYFDGPLGYIAIFGFSLYFCKDIVNGRSFAKRILKLQLIDNATGKVASPLQCLVRNVLCIIWPVEVIVAMLNTNKRLGDRIAGTKLIKFDPALEQPKINIGKLLIPVIISYAIVVLGMQLTPKIEMAQTDYIESSFNQPESKELERLFIDSLGQYLMPDVRIYDTVQNEHLKYVSAIFKLKANYIADESNYNQLHEITTNLIYSKHPKETFMGQIKYIYQGAGQFQSRSTTIGTSLQR
ncbi:MAG TPA: RDD family protein [Lacibacter sp.]|nr:RDD family protein [Lacibacter sp.]